MSKCKVCSTKACAAWRERHRQAYREMTKAHYAKSEAKKETGRKAAKKWRANNPEKVRDNCGRRRTALKQATPSWVDSLELEAIHFQRKQLQRSLGLRLTVDHIVPIRSDVVCGLNVPWNIRIIDLITNAKKGNRFDPMTFDDRDYPCMLRETSG